MARQVEQIPPIRDLNGGWATGPIDMNRAADRPQVLDAPTDDPASSERHLAVVEEQLRRLVAEKNAERYMGQNRLQGLAGLLLELTWEEMTAYADGSTSDAKAVHAWAKAHQHGALGADNADRG